MKWIYRIIKQLLTLLIINIPLQLLGIPIVAIELLFHLHDKRLNNCLDQRLLLKWFDNGDEKDLIYGLNGDLGYQHTNNITVKSTKWEIYKARFIWLAIRNPLNYYKYRVIGVRTSKLGRITYQKNYIQGIGNNPLLEVSDWHYAGVRIIDLDKGGWEVYIVYKYPFKQDRCLRIRMGYKLGHNRRDTTRLYTQWVCAIQPWKSYIGK